MFWFLYGPVCTNPGSDGIMSGLTGPADGSPPGPVPGGFSMTGTWRDYGVFIRT
jgi:hypothetical protein